MTCYGITLIRGYVRRMFGVRLESDSRFETHDGRLATMTFNESPDPRKRIVGRAKKVRNAFRYRITRRRRKRY